MTFVHRASQITSTRSHGQERAPHARESIQKGNYE
jgi:hypothetical protein